MEKFKLNKKINNLLTNIDNKSTVEFIELNLLLSSYHSYYLNDSVSALKAFCLQWWGQEPKQVFLPRKCRTISVLRSPHVDKKAQDHFEQITFKRALKLSIPNTSSNILKLCNMEEALLSLRLGSGRASTQPFQSVLLQFEVKLRTSSAR